VKIVAVASGKGGVGKSTVSLNVARALAQRGAAVGLLDADVYGPDIPLMIGLKQTRDLKSWMLGLNPAFGRLELDPVERLGLKIMSVGFLLAEGQALMMPATLVELVGRQLIHGVRWGDLDYLIVDLPPGTADLQQQLFRTVDLAGAIVVVGPQAAAHLDARKLIAMLRDAAVPILGAVENMRGLECPHCGGQIDVFPPIAEARSILRDVELLGTVPLDPAYARLNGVPEPFVRIAERLEAALA
jgi:ATP-binding protein involved in chromosome partitioning